jgi:cobalamin biosynthesis protein CobC
MGAWGAKSYAKVKTPIEHGGDLTAARELFPSAPEPFLNLSTGINPFAYPVPTLVPEVFANLPERKALERLATVAASFYGAPSPAHVVAAAGTQILLSHVFSLVPSGYAAVLGPTYAEHAHVAGLVGHSVVETGDVEDLADTDLAVVVNPNNPDGAIRQREVLLSLADRLAPRGGLLVVDEAFLDVAPTGTTLAGDVTHDHIVVLRSFGKFFGLAGLRLGFALATPRTAERLRSLLGPWAISGPALAIGTAAFSDRDWIDMMRVRLATEAIRLDALLHEARLQVIGGTPLFQTIQSETADRLFLRLGQAGILVRRFSDRRGLLRFGLPRGDEAWRRLREVLLS